MLLYSLKISRVKIFGEFSSFVDKIFVDWRSTALNYALGQVFSGLKFCGFSKIHENFHL